jgi:hypothetical protein
MLQNASKFFKMLQSASKCFKNAQKCFQIIPSYQVKIKIPKTPTIPAENLPNHPQQKKGVKKQ